MHAYPRVFLEHVIFQQNNLRSFLLRGRFWKGIILPEILSWIRSAIRLALVHYAGYPVDQRTVANVGMTHHPAQIAGRPPYVVRAHPVHCIHGVVQYGYVPTHGPLDALWLIWKVTSY